MKPSNIIFDKQGYCRLADLGLAREIVLADHHGPFTPGYVAPEIIKKGTEEFGPEADFFSLGVIAYKLMFGHIPYHSSNKKDFRGEVQH
jgi:serine/threonine protein kinase